MHKITRSSPLFASIVLAAILSLSACKEDEKKAPPPPAVTVIDVAPADLPLSYEYAGRTAGSREVEIRARVSGILLKRAYVEGQPVKKGDLLFTIDPAPFEAALADAEARFAQARKEWARVGELRKAEAISAREAEQAESAYEQAKALVRTARINLGYTTVTAPIDGVTSVEGLSEGSLVAADTSLLTRISQLDPLYVYFSSPDMDALTQRRKVAEGTLTLPEDRHLKAEIRFGDGTTYDQLGIIDFTDSIITPETGTVRARAVMPNPDTRLLPGQFVRVIVKGFTRKGAIAIPDQAIMQGPQGPFVYTVNAESKATITPVSLGELQGKLRLIESGLKAGDRVVTEGMIKARPDAPVTIAAPVDAETPKAADKAP